MDFDGNLSTKDLCELDETIDAQSKLGKEVAIFKEFYVRILHKGKLKETDIVDVGVFSALLPGQTSCIVDELMKKCIAPPGSFASESVFIPSLGDMEEYKERQRRLIANDKQNRDTDGIISQDKDPNRFKKTVTFLPEKAAE